jgi:phenylacetate-CoA ligase
MGRADEVYRRLPVAFQHAGVTAFGAHWWWQRFGPGYRADVERFAARERLSAEAWQRWQSDRVRSVLRHAAETVPYYRDEWSAAEHRAAEAGALHDLPLLAKDPIRADPTRFLSSTGRPRRPLVFATSGSSGTPLATYWTVAELRRSMAVREVRSARWAGVSFSMPRATFSGRIVEPDPNSDGPYYRFNAVERQIYLSAFHLGVATAPVYADAFRRHHIRWGTGYAVSFTLLAKALIADGAPPLALDAVVTTSEHLSDDGRDAIRGAFGCPAFEEYSSVENVVFATECERGSLHVSPDVGVVEILRDDGTPTDPGEVGEVVATGLLRTWQPFIRFRIGDRAAWSDRPCPCGRELPVLAEVSGRVEDVLTGPDGRQLVRFHGVFIGLPSVVEGQVVQESPTRFVVRVVPTDAFSPDDRHQIVERMHQRLGEGAEVSVVEVTAIERTKAGKFPAVVSLVEPTASRSSTEAERMREVYGRYDEPDGRARLWSEDNAGNLAIVAERDRLVAAALDRALRGDRQRLRLLDLGCGRAAGLTRMTTLGFSPANVVGIDLLDTRLRDARRSGLVLPLLAADATAVPLARGSVDVALAFTVFSSIADRALAATIVAELERVLRPGGVVLWYDLRRDNPRNPEVHGLDRDDVQRLFGGWTVCLQSCTLVPPLARRLGLALPYAYRPLAALLPLRTHLVGTIRRP